MKERYYLYETEKFVYDPGNLGENTIYEDDFIDLRYRFGGSYTIKKGNSYIFGSLLGHFEGKSYKEDGITNYLRCIIEIDETKTPKPYNKVEEYVKPQIIEITETGTELYTNRDEWAYILQERMKKPDFKYLFE